MQVNILNGIYSDSDADLRTSYPRNLIPVPKQSGVSNGFLRPAEGIIEFGTTAGPGVDRGGINWNDVCYRVMGTKLVSVSELGVITTIGDVGGATDPVTFDYSFDRLAVNSDNKLYYYDGVTLSQVTDGDLGDCLDFIWIDGYFMSIDGDNIIVSDLTYNMDGSVTPNPDSFNALKYGSSELDPDEIVGLLKLRNEVVALNRYTVEFFDNIGGDNFPFQRIDGAQLQRGCIGRHAKCIFNESVAFLGGGRNESPAIWLGANGQTYKLSTHEIDQILSDYTEAELQNAVLLSRSYGSHQHLWVVLPDKTMVYDHTASEALSNSVWFSLTTSLTGDGKYSATFPVWCYGKWIVGDPTSAHRVGYLSYDVSSHWGSENGWEFQTGLIYNNSTGAIVHELELVALTGRVALGDDPVISTSYSLDGVTYSQESYISAGKQGDRSKRLKWFRQGHMRNMRLQRFRGTSEAHLSFLRLEAVLESLSA